MIRLERKDERHSLEISASSRWKDWVLKMVCQSLEVSFLFERDEGWKHTISSASLVQRILVVVVG